MHASVMYDRLFSINIESKFWGFFIVIKNKFMTLHGMGKEELLMETLQYTLSARLGNKYLSSRILHSSLGHSSNSAVVI